MAVEAIWQMVVWLLIGAFALGFCAGWGAADIISMF